MKCRPDEMQLFELDYGDLLRPPYRILPDWGWGQCTNQTDEFVIIYGPKHVKESSIFDTSPYILPPGLHDPGFLGLQGISAAVRQDAPAARNYAGRSSGHQVLEFPALLAQDHRHRHVRLFLGQWPFSAEPDQLGNSQLFVPGNFPAHRANCCQIRHVYIDIKGVELSLGTAVVFETTL